MVKATRFWRMDQSTTGISKMVRSTDMVFTYGPINHNIKEIGETMSSKAKESMSGVTEGST